MNITKNLRNYFLRGMAVILPTILTIWIFVWGYSFIQNNISIHINKGLVRLIIYFQGEDHIPIEDLHKMWVNGPGSFVGFLLALVAVFIVGAMLANVFGKTLWRIIEKFILNTPFLKQIYPYVKQITDFLFNKEEQKELFSRVVAVQYPRKGIWSLGMVTGTGLASVAQKERKEMLTVLIPTSPTPFTGFVITVPKKETIEMEMTIEEAIRFTVSGGVITPGTILNNSQENALTYEGNENKQRQNISSINEDG